MRANRLQESVEEHLVAILIISIIVDILDHVRIEHFKRSSICWIIVSNFLVLYPEIGFQDFGGRRKPENIHIALGKSASESASELLGSGIAFTHQ